MKGLTISKIKGKYASTNGGVSDNNDTFFVTGFDWLDQDGLEENTNNLPVLKIVRRPGGYWNGGKNYYHAEPLNSPDRGSVGWMNGGNMLDMCIEEQEIVNIHDRQESAEQYKALST